MQKNKNLGTLTIQPPKGISLEEAKSALKMLKFKVIKEEVIEEKDDTKMTKEDFFAMIDKARAGKKYKISREEMRKMLLGK